MNAKDFIVLIDGDLYGSFDQKFVKCNISEKIISYDVTVLGTLLLLSETGKVFVITDLFSDSFNITLFTEPDINDFQLAPKNMNIIHMSSSFHYLLLDQKGEVYGWGNNNNTLDNSFRTFFTTGRIENLPEKIISVACNITFSFFLGESATLYLAGIYNRNNNIFQISEDLLNSQSNTFARPVMKNVASIWSDGINVYIKSNDQRTILISTNDDLFEFRFDDPILTACSSSDRYYFLDSNNKLFFATDHVTQPEKVILNFTVADIRCLIMAPHQMLILSSCNDLYQYVDGQAIKLRLPIEGFIELKRITSECRFNKTKSANKTIRN